MCGAEMVASWPIDLYSTVQDKIHGYRVCVCEGNALGRVFVCMPLVEDVVCAVDGLHRLESIMGRKG